MVSERRSITATKNYRLFTVGAGNRPRHAKKHKRLHASMVKYGFLACFPIVCCRDKVGALVVQDGQHRLMFAEELGLPVYYVVESADFDIAEINSTSKIWSLVDYAQKFATHGSQSYVEGLEFAEQFKLPIGTAFAMLSGTTSFGNVQEQFVSGKFRIKDKGWAEQVAALYSGLIAISRDVVTKRCIEACMAVCRVEGFDQQRLLHGAQRNREALVSYSTRDGYLDMMETIYNFGKKQLVPLKIQAAQAMRERRPNQQKRGANPATN